MKEIIDNHYTCTLHYRFDGPDVNLHKHQFSVLVGAHRPHENEPSQRRHKVRRIVLHERFLHETPRFDVMLLQVTPKIQYTREVRPICLDERGFPDHTICMVTGWGSINTTGASATFIAERYNLHCRVQLLSIIIVSVCHGNGNYISLSTFIFVSFMVLESIADVCGICK